MVGWIDQVRGWDDDSLRQLAEAVARWAGYGTDDVGAKNDVLTIFSSLRDLAEREVHELPDDLLARSGVPADRSRRCSNSRPRRSSC